MIVFSVRLSGAGAEVPISADSRLGWALGIGGWRDLRGIILITFSGSVIDGEAQRAVLSWSCIYKG